MLIPRSDAVSIRLESADRVASDEPHIHSVAQKPSEHLSGGASHDRESGSRQRDRIGLPCVPRPKAWATQDVCRTSGPVHHRETVPRQGLPRELGRAPTAQRGLVSGYSSCRTDVRFPLTSPLQQNGHNTARTVAPCTTSVVLPKRSLR